MGGHDPLAEGQVLLGKYRIERKLGAGGMAVVYRAINLGAAGFERPVVIKVIRPQLAEQQGVVQQFIREASVGASLIHPNIVQTIDLGEFEGILYIVMELVQGKDLAAIIHRARHTKRVLGPELVAFICIDVCKALECSHDHLDENGESVPVIHRDISPQNILLSRDGHVKLADFGMARALGTARLTRQGVVKGKLSYMSPEQSRGLEVNPTSDLFSLGVVMWETLTGRRLFLAKDPIVTVKRLRACEVPRLDEIAPHVSEDLANIVHALLSKDPSARPAAATVVRRALQSFLRGARPVEPTAIADLVEAYFPSKDDPSLQMAVSDLSFTDEGEIAETVEYEGLQDDEFTKQDEAPKLEDAAPTHTLLMFGEQAEALSDAFKKAQEAAKDRTETPREEKSSSTARPAVAVPDAPPDLEPGDVEHPEPGDVEHPEPGDVEHPEPGDVEKFTIPGVGKPKYPPPAPTPPTLIVEASALIPQTAPHPVVDQKKGSRPPEARPNEARPQVARPQEARPNDPRPTMPGLDSEVSVPEDSMLSKAMILSLLIGIPVAALFGLLVFWLLSTMTR